MAVAPVIMAIGGGNMRIGETRRIDERIVELSGKRRPRVLFCPTASGDSPEYVDVFRAVYGRDLGCDVDVLPALCGDVSEGQLSQQVGSADIVYVAGGNTLRMLDLWRRYGVDALLRQAASRGCVMSGISAGAICWFSHGHSDSKSFDTGDNPWEYIKVDGLGLVPALFCPHYHSEHREQDLARMVSDTGLTAVACDDNTAIEILGEQWRVFRSRRSGKAYRVRPLADGAEVERLAADHEYRPLSMLAGEAAMPA